MKKFFKGVGIFFAILIIVALSIMLYANYSNYTYDKDKTLDQTNQIAKRQQGGNSALCKMGNMLN